MKIDNIKVEYSETASTQDYSNVHFGASVTVTLEGEELSSTYELLSRHVKMAVQESIDNQLMNLGLEPKHHEGPRAKTIGAIAGEKKFIIIYPAGLDDIEILLHEKYNQHLKLCNLNNLPDNFPTERVHQAVLEAMKSTPNTILVDWSTIDAFSWECPDLPNIPESFLRKDKDTEED